MNDRIIDRKASQSVIFDISYIIPFKAANAERTKALFSILKRLRNYFPEMEIMVVEQDEVSKLQLDITQNIKHIFIQNSSHFNKSWAINIAAKNTNKKIFVFGDSDIFLEKEDYLTCFTAAEKFEAITPNKTEAINIVLPEEEQTEFKVLNKRPLYTFAGGLLILTRKAFFKIGGCDERFEGWGGEDDAMSHIIYNKLSAKTFHFPFYHINHSRTEADGKQQKKYEYNRALADEIKTLYGLALERYIDFLKESNLGVTSKYEQQNPKRTTSKKLKFVLAITTYNRLDYLKACVTSFLETRNENIEWQLIIADDGSSDGTKSYIEKLQREQAAIIIQNDRVDVHRQVNTILKTLSTFDFDLCFKCDDDVVFLREGWDNLYWKTIKRTGYQHLIFYDESWRPYANLPRPIKHGKLISNCLQENIQGALYTLTKDVIRNVGYFDEQQFGRRGVGHVDFSFRCCRAGFNVLASPFDVLGSNDFIQLQSADTYTASVSSKYKSLFNPKEVIEFKKELVKANRVYIPYNENFHSMNERIGADENTKFKSAKILAVPKYPKANATFYPERGVIGFFGFLLKRFYNLSINLRLYFIPKGIKKIGRFLNKISVDLIDIEK